MFHRGFASFTDLSLQGSSDMFDEKNRAFRVRACARAKATDLNSITIDGGTFNASTLQRFNAA